MNEDVLSFHKRVMFEVAPQQEPTAELTIHGIQMGWTDGVTTIDGSKVQNTLQRVWARGGENALATFMVGLVGPCIVEVSTGKTVWFFVSCASSGFYWTLAPSGFDARTEYLLSNQEGAFLRSAHRAGGELNEAAVMNAVLSHQSVARPPFHGLIGGTHRCQPGFFMKFSPDEVSLNSYLVNPRPKRRRDQDAALTRKMKAVAALYSSYFHQSGTTGTLAFSGGVDSTALLLLHKDGLNGTAAGYYKDTGKDPEKKMASELARRAGCRIDFVQPVETFSASDARKMAEAALTALTGTGAMKHGFRTSPTVVERQKQTFVLTGQNSDTLFHVDHYAPSSFTTGWRRTTKMFEGLLPRFRTTVLYYTFLRPQHKKLPRGLPPGVIGSYTSFHEHPRGNGAAESEVARVVFDYKKTNYVSPMIHWIEREVDPQLRGSPLRWGLRANHVARLARWVRTIGSFHQQFHSRGTHEKLVICTPFSEGPVATELLSYRLGIRDVLVPKRFLHSAIRRELGTTYGNIRREVLGRGWGGSRAQAAKKSMRSPKRFIRRVLSKFSGEKKTDRHTPTLDDLRKLREILGHEDGVVRRSLVDYVSNSECRKYLDYLYDCLELKVNPSGLNREQGSQLCRLVNLQVMLDAEDSTSPIAAR